MVKWTNATIYKQKLAIIREAQLEFYYGRNKKSRRISLTMYFRGGWKQKVVNRC